jgi:phage gp16-like protein
MFKSLVPALVIASALAVPALAQAADNAPVTRAEVKAQLAQLERAGYNPASDQTTYPANIQAAEARVDARQTQTVAASSYGGVNEGASASGGARHANFLSRIVRPEGDANAVDFDRP